MKTSTLLSLFAFMALSIQAQDYRLMVDDSRRLFDNGDVLRAIRVDSSTVEGDAQIHHLSSTIKPVNIEDTYCLTPYGDSWMGPHVMSLPNGLELVFNAYGDSIRIRPQREVGDPWMVYDDGELKIRGEVIEKSAGMVLGQPDTIKTIAFTALNANLDPISHPVNELTIGVSKENGMTRTLNFYAFPDGFEEYYSLPLQSYDLVGREGAAEGVDNLTWHGVYDFQPGDELHVRQGHTSFGSGMEYRYILRYIQRENLGDSIRYLVEQSFDAYEIEGAQMNYEYSSVDTLERLITAHEAFDQWSMLPYIAVGDAIIAANHHRQQSGSPARKTYNDGTEINYDDVNLCWYPILDGGCEDGSSIEYIEERGGPYYDCTTGASARNYRILEYSSIGGVETGEPFTLILPTVDGHRADEWRIHPNPANEGVQVELNPDLTPATFTLWDLRGRRVKSVEITSPHTVIDLEALPPGPYIHSIQDRRGRRITGKLMIE